MRSRSIRCRHLLLDVLPPEWVLAHVLARDYVDLSVIKIDLGFTVIKGAEIFQSVNPLIVVCLTPLVMYVFGRLRDQGKEPLLPARSLSGWVSLLWLMSS